MKPTVLTRTVKILSFVSLLNDIASEMLYPVMPVYLKSIGFSVILIGVLEGIAEAVAGISKGYFGSLSDRIGQRLPFIKWGYLLSALSKPLLAIAKLPTFVFSARTIDRLGKGIRTGARDAMLSDEATTETKGAVFGFHRSLDSLGAVIGPLIALVYLYYAPAQYKPLFFFAFIPGILSFFLLFFIKNNKPNARVDKKAYSFWLFINYWKISSKQYKQLSIGIILFTLFNSSDYFLLLKMKDVGLNDIYVIGIYIMYNCLYALLSYPLGKLGDQIGLKKVFLFGLLLFALVYAGMAFNTSVYIYLLLFIIYGIYAAATDGISKAWISNICYKSETGTAIGTMAAFQSIATMIASSTAGIIWYCCGSNMLFLLSASVSVLVFFYLVIVFRNRK